MFKKYIIFSLVIALLIIPHLSLARDRLGIAIDQTVISFDVEAGENQNFKLNIENISSEDEIIRVLSQDEEIKDNNEISLLDGDNQLNGLKNWIWINEENLTLAPQEKKDINFTLNVPSQATPGSHFGAIVFQAFPRVDSESLESPIVSGRIAVHVLINVKGDISGKGQISRFEAPVFANNEAKLEVAYKNEGNIHYVPYGEVKVFNWLTRKESLTKLEKHFVFPGTEYTYQVEQKINSFFGIYTAEASFVDGEGNFIQKKKVIMGSFSLPIIILIIAVLIAFIRLYMKRTGFVQSKSVD